MQRKVLVFLIGKSNFCRGRLRRAASRKIHRQNRSDTRTHTICILNGCWRSGRVRNCVTGAPSHPCHTSCGDVFYAVISRAQRETILVIQWNSRKHGGRGTVPVQSSLDRLLRWELQLPMRPVMIPEAPKMPSHPPSLLLHLSLAHALYLPASTGVYNSPYWSRYRRKDRQ